MKRKAPSDISLTQRTLLDQRSNSASDQPPSVKDDHAKTSIATETPGTSDDVIEDDYDSFDEIFTQHFSGDGTSLHDDSRDTSNCPGDPRLPQMALPYSQKNASTTRRFVIPPLCDPKPRQSPQINTNGEDLPWAQRFGPTNLSELAVHKRKVSDVRDWLNNALDGTGKRLLVLRGPAGSGKTATVSVLSETLGFDILEWRNPTASNAVTNVHSSIASQFGDFLERGNELPGLELDGRSGSSQSQSAGNESYSQQRRIIVVEEFPSLTAQSSSLLVFRLAVQRYLAITALARNMSAQSCSPVVMIISETLLDSGSSFPDNITAHRLLGSAICNHPGTSIIDFNSIAPTFMFKALNLIIEKEGRVSQSKRVLSPAVMRSLSRSGDIRSATSTLEFICLQAGDPAERTKSSRFKHSSRGTSILTPLEEKTLGLITQREASLGLFHAVGKVVYNKRDDPGSEEDAQPVKPPSYLRQHDRPRISQVQVNELRNEIGTDAQTFISALHENYVLSCNGASFTECLDGCTSALSDSDLLYPIFKGSSKFFVHATSTSAAVEALRQQDISYQIAARGLLFALPDPVTRTSSFNDGAGSARHAQQLLYPALLRSFHDKEEIEGLVTLWTSRLLNSIGRPAPRSILKPDNIETNDSQAVAATMMSRSDLLLHQLPYMACLVEGAKECQELEKITRFSKCKLQAPGKPKFSVEIGTPGATIELPGDTSKSGVRGYGTTLDACLASMDDEEGLTLSDDEIIDDG
ncbi:putative cell cycle checkpoint protein Rad17 [Aspergillus homomorphus CBS 101889]|uniref:Cell cycle checkpoint protein rad17 n=1 Tax=Aspergillus homomorphus (strain CBS 101889) TaxID=1450537 RepID=A0A395HGK0_ASPHC|nr:cell cycle checkpoint protein rad17 [Aspergillus homomorphus CBS 101889]RAL06880.1 cell cycle checkpoint protein rad17 [Aspergillus homomorphus CBS 101889]